MKYKAILFDLDGTLLPMEDLSAFKQMIGILMGKKLRGLGLDIDPKAFSEANHKGISAMKENDGSRTNQEAFYEEMYKGLGEQGEIGCRIFHDFYENDFEPVKETCGYDPRAGETISILKEKGYRLVLATTPWFPKCGIESRMRWAGLDKDAFEFYTTFDSSGYCKPNEGYYWEILERLVLKPEDCLMVGNDVTEDMSAADLGMDVFLMTRNLINKDGVDISGYPQGGFEELLEYIEKE